MEHRPQEVTPPPQLSTGPPPGGGCQPEDTLEWKGILHNSQRAPASEWDEGDCQGVDVLGTCCNDLGKVTLPLWPSQAQGSESPGSGVVRSVKREGERQGETQRKGESAPSEEGSS